jgi:hypothetical protein
LKASFNFSCGTVPDKTWEIVACTTEIVFCGTSSTFSAVFPGFWESKGKTDHKTKLRKMGSTLSVQGTINLPVGVSSESFSPPPSFGSLSLPSSSEILSSLLQHQGVENSEA